MPYDVAGWIEIVRDHTIDEEQQDWSGVVDLSRFMLAGDVVSDFLFGLSKMPSENAPFAKRGIPSDCSKHVAREIQKNEEFIREYGEGDFNHTYALLSEIRPRLESIDSNELLISEWSLVFKITDLLTQKEYKSEWIRIVVWGNW